MSLIDPPEKIKLDWDHVYLLGWYNRDGVAHLTSWSGGNPNIHVVVSGPKVLTYGPPLWNASISMEMGGYPVEDFTLHELKLEEDWQSQAQKLGGVIAFGWYIPKGFKRGKIGDISLKDGINPFIEI